MTLNTILEYALSLAEYRLLIKHIEKNNIGSKNRYYHIAAIILNGQFICGTNSDREYRNGCNYSRHAEIDAVTKLPPPKNKKRVKKIDLLVIRISESGVLKNSKPCLKCIKHLLGIRYYRINNVYYSNNTTIIKTKLQNLIKDSTYRSSRFN